MKDRSLEFEAKMQLGRGVVCRGCVCLIIALVGCTLASAEGWVTYRHDNARSAITTESATPPLSLGWAFKSTHAPKPAWPLPAEELQRMHSDNAYHVTVANGVVYFGSSVDNKVYALDAATGEERWTFFTEGPVRFAPSVWNDRVYLGSDDGNVYCLGGNDGSLIWKYRAGPSDEKVIGNGRMISAWPVRTSVLVDDGIVYFGAGVFPYEGLYICALDANDGAVIWKNDTVGDRAHELAYGGISPQSYLVITERNLYVPSGRATPAVFDRTSGQFVRYLDPGGKFGGTWALLVDDKLIVGTDQEGTPTKAAYDDTRGVKSNVYARYQGLDLVITSAVSYVLSEKGIYAINRVGQRFAAKRLKTIMGEQQTLVSELEDLRERLHVGDDQTREELQRQRDEVAQQISELVEEEKRLTATDVKWEHLKENLCSLILVGNVVFAGGDGIVIAVHAETGNELWSSEVDGKAFGLAASDGRLFVSTDIGGVYCFTEENVSEAKDIVPPINPSPYPTDSLTPIYEAAAEAILRETGINKGYCLVLDGGTGRLAFELAKRTDLKIVGIEDDADKIEIAKKSLDAAGLYGSRVVIEGWELSSLPDYFANLIVSDGIVISGRTGASAQEMSRVLRPCGGVAYLGQSPEASSIGELVDSTILLEWLRESGAPEPEVTQENGVWVKVTRGKLEGAGSWTEQYGNPQNTACSGDQLVNSPLGVLWYGDPGPRYMVERHARAAAPVSIDGRLFVQGEEVIMAYDAYNGTFLWKREIPGAVRVRVDVDGGNLAVTEDGLYVAAYEKCYRLDPATGETIRVYEMPPSPDGSPRRWGYVSCVGKILFGSTATPLRREYGVSSEWSFPHDDWTTQALRYQRDGNHWRSMASFPSWGSQTSQRRVTTRAMMVGDSVFALDADTGEMLWIYRGNQIANITVTIGDGRIFIVDRPLTEEQKTAVLEEREELIQRGIYEEHPWRLRELSLLDMDFGLVLALDAATGVKVWEKQVDFTGCGGDKMGGAYHDGILFFFGCFSNHDGSYFTQGTLKWRRITALSADTGEMIWSRPLNYLRRPLIVGDTIIIEPRACDARTGEIITRSHPITGEPVPWEFLRPGHCCSITSAAANALFYRSYCGAIYDLAEDTGVDLFGAIRPGCWINMIPANGLLLFPEASSGCTCSFPLRCSVTLAPKNVKKSRQWTVFITHADMTPAKHFAINFGAPGDMKDKEGNVWFGYPRVKTKYTSHGGASPYGVRFRLRENVLPGMGFFCRDFERVNIEGTDKPWLFTSGCFGLLRCEVPLINQTGGEEPDVYTVRLGFMAPPSDAVGQRVFDIKIQGNVVLGNFDILGNAGGPNKVVIKEFKGIQVESNLEIELVPKVSDPTIGEAPLINFITAVSEQVTGVEDWRSHRALRF